MIRDRDSVYGDVFPGRVKAMGIEEVLSAPRSPWQSPYVERLIGSIRRERLDAVVILHERQLRRVLTAYFAHYHCWRCHQALAMDCPEPRAIQGREQGAVVEAVEGTTCPLSQRASTCLIMSRSIE